MEVIIEPSKLSGTVSAPPSKSCMHRALICAAAADRPTDIICSCLSKDTEATIRCLGALGAEIEVSDSLVRVSPIDRDKENDEALILDCNESGSTLRFMLPFAAALGKKCVFKGAERLGQRPLLPLCEALEKNGVSLSYKEAFLPCTIEGRLGGNVFEIPADISSQFITGLLFALGVIGGGRIKTTTPLKSGPYIDITTDIQEKFGVIAEKTADGYIIKEGQKYTSPGKIEIEGDYSNAAFWLTAGAIGNGSITCTSLREDSLQGDRKIIDILRLMGADITRDGDKVTVKRSRLKAAEIDCSDIPDIVPVLCVAASAAEGITVFKNIERLRAKESDRVQTTADMITALGGSISFDETNIYVTGTSLRGGTVTSANDHRIAMSAAVASLICSEKVVIKEAEAVSKSYPDFYENFIMLGGKCNELYSGK